MRRIWNWKELGIGGKYAYIILTNICNGKFFQKASKAQGYDEGKAD